MTAAALDTYANYSTPPKKAGRQKPSALAMRHRLRRRSGRILGNRTKHCGRTMTGDHVTLVRTADGRAYYQGVATCGSIWTCPVCAAKIAAKRQSEIETLLQAHRDAGGHVYLATMTVPHCDKQRLDDLRQGVVDAWGKVTAGAPWVRLKQRFGVVGYVRCLEVTHGDNGWHPHIHALIFTAHEIHDERLSDAIWDRWEDKVRNAGLGRPDRQGFDLQHVREGSGDAAARYVAKWGCGAEISKAAAKQGRGGNRSPWQLLADADRGDIRAGGLWKSYGQTFHGKRHLIWSKGLRELYGLRTVDDQKAAEDGAETEALDGLDNGIDTGRVGMIDRDTWKQIVRGDMTAEVLEVVAREGYAALVGWLYDRHGLSVHGRSPAHWAGRTLPQQKPTNFDSLKIKRKIAQHHFETTIATMKEERSRA